ncbi:MAG: squalene/phytoene synthase family protein [Myxococcota bacterium]
MTTQSPVVRSRNPKVGKRREVMPADWRFCDEMLPRVSRTFALSIAALPPDLRRAISVSYLLCRIVDTVEDDAVVVGVDRERLYAEFDALMIDDRRDAARLEELTSALDLAVGSPYRDLCLRSGAVFRAYASLTLEHRGAIRPHVLEMSRGMREFTQRADARGTLRIRDLAELERYCYFVAGTVGKLLTALFERHVPQLPAHDLVALRGRAVSFGLALQMVNIVKDVAEDLPRGDCFLPTDLAADEGLELSQILLPEHREAGLRIIGRVCARAREHLRRAQEYTLLWPATGAGVDVRLFCTVPLTLALATLREVEAGPDTLRPGRTPKVTRAVVTDVFANAKGAARDDRALRRLFDRYGEDHTVLGVDDAVGMTAEGDDPGERDDLAGAPPVSGRAPVAAEGGRRRLMGTYRGRALVTGAAGHFGANMVHALLDDGIPVRVLLRRGSDNAAMEGLDVERVYGDLRDPEACRRAVEGCETVFHCASKVSTLQGGKAHKEEVYESNVTGTRRLLAAIKESDVRRTVVTGSLGANGYHRDDPTRPADETVPFYPFAVHTPYARTKHEMEHEVLKAVVDGVDVVMCTSVAILGPHDYKPSRMGRTLIDYTHGRLRAYIPGGIEFVSARDLVRGHVLALEKGRAGHKYTISTQWLSLDDIMAAWEEITGVPRPRRRLPARVMLGLGHVSSFVLTNFFPRLPQRFTPDAVRILMLSRRADITKAREELGFEPGDIREAMQEAYDDFARRGLVPPRLSVVDAAAETKSETATGASAAA